jgi:hypothetical protein
MELNIRYKQKAMNWMCSKENLFYKWCVRVFGWLERNFTEGEFSNSQTAGRNVYKEVAIMWKNKERSVD